MSVVCYQVEFCASGWSLFQRSPTERGVSAWIDNPRQRGGQGPLVPVYQENIDIYIYIYNIECTITYGNTLFLNKLIPRAILKNMMIMLVWEMMIIFFKMFATASNKLHKLVTFNSATFYVSAHPANPWTTLPSTVGLNMYLAQTHTKSRELKQLDVCATGSP